MLSLEPRVGRQRNHELAEIRGPVGRKVGDFAWITAGLEPCDGRNCKVGTITWPRLRKQPVVPQVTA
jgi:hypothetical protein